jgi:hypothetical protein
MVRSYVSLVVVTFTALNRSIDRICVNASAAIASKQINLMRLRGKINMKFSVGRISLTFAASSMLLAMLCLTAVHAQDADDSSSAEANTSTVVQVAGTWTGMDTQDGSSPGPMTMVLTQNQKSLGGTFSLTGGNETPVGNLMGVISKDNLKLTFVTTGGTSHRCTASVLATVDTTAMPPTMAGTFLVKNRGKHCKGKGTFDLTLQ